MHHLCLVSNQAMPNFLPVLNKELRPNKVTLAVTAQMRNKAFALREALEVQGILVDELPITNNTDLSAMLETFMAWLDERQDEEILLNVTGGTKLMAIAAQEIFRLGAKPVFYVDIDTDRVLWLDDEKRPELILTRQPTIRTAFAINGFQVTEAAVKSDIPAGWRRFAQTLSDNVRQWSSAIGALNWVAMGVENSSSLRYEARQGERITHRGWADLVEELKEADLIERVSGVGEAFSFVSEEALKFCKGGWLEHYLFRLAKEKFGFSKDQIWMNVKIKTEDVSNELDCVIFLHSTFYILEAKAKNLKREKERGTKQTNAEDAIYKLAQLSQQQGLRTKGIIISARGVRQVDKKRAKSFRLSLLDDLATVPNELAKILKI